MKIQIESTGTITNFGGVEVREWKGITEDGVQVLVMVHRIVVVDEGAKVSTEELVEREQPSILLTLSHASDTPDKR